MSDLFAAATAPATPLAEVITLHPDYIRVRCEREDVYWVERMRGAASTACVAYTLAELHELRSRLETFLGPVTP